MDRNDKYKSNIYIYIYVYIIYTYKSCIVTNNFKVITDPWEKGAPWAPFQYTIACVHAGR